MLIMFSGQTIRRLFRRNTEKHTRRRPLSRWDRCRLSLTLLEDRRVPATITVTNSSDVVGLADGVSLREALQSINAGGDQSDVVAVGAYGTNDSIVFDTAVFNTAKTITLTANQLTISKPVVITGPTA